MPDTCVCMQVCGVYVCNYIYSRGGKIFNSKIEVNQSNVHVRGTEKKIFQAAKDSLSLRKLSSLNFSLLWVKRKTVPYPSIQHCNAGHDKAILIDAIVAGT